MTRFCSSKSSWPFYEHGKNWKMKSFQSRCCDLLSFVLQSVFLFLHLVKRFVVWVDNFFMPFNFLCDFLSVQHKKVSNIRQVASAPRSKFMCKDIEKLQSSQTLLNCELLSQLSTQTATTKWRAKLQRDLAANTFCGKNTPPPPRFVCASTNGTILEDRSKPTLICSSSFVSCVVSFFKSVSSRRICSCLSRIALFSDFSSFVIHLSRSSFEVNWFPRPCLAYSSFLRCSAKAKL